MRLKLSAACIVVLLSALAAPVQGQDRAGEFDYYVMALSWSPGWCATEGQGNRDQCAHPLSFVLHGLWPQNERGWPQDCRTPHANPTRRETSAMADIMGSGGLAWHQWKKHGRCSGLSSRAYFDLARQAFGTIRIPDAFDRLDRDIRLPASVVEEAFIDANPGLTPAMIGVTCDGGRIDEVRLCLTRDLVPRPCSQTIARDCRARDALMERVR